jgi:beta-galactosidase
MSHVSIQNKVIKVGELEVPLISGEVHYWRLDPDNWKNILITVSEMGIKVIATYICWDYHEMSPGVYDFAGKTNPRRNLTGFLDLLTELGFWIIFRPGPYIYSEWKNGGVPDDAARYHRLDPAFQTRAMQYMQAVTEVAKPYLATNGGRILLWQSDNEIDPWPHWYTEQLGLGRQVGPFHDYLKTRYQNVNELNAVWQTLYASIEQARAVIALFSDEPTKLRRYIDFVDFQHWYVNQVSEWGVNAYRELGVDVPIYLNAYSGVGTQSWSEMEMIADLVGTDTYPTNEFSHWPNEHRNFLDSIRYTAAMSKLPYIAEFEAGTWHDWLGDVGMLSSNHYVMAGISALSAGVAGWNWYMLVNRDNWYQSPINEWGRTRPDLFAAFQKMVSLYNEVQPYAWEKQTNTALTYNPQQRASVRPAQPLFQAVYDAGVDYAFFDTVRGECNRKVLFYAGSHWIARDVQEKLKKYVEQGGNLVFLGTYPYLDENLQPCNLLEIVEPDGILRGLPKIDLSLPIGTECSAEWFYNYREVPGTPIYAKRLAPKSIVAEENYLQWNLQNEEQYIVGYTQNLGKGKIIQIGVNPSKELILQIHQFLAVKIPARSLTPGIQVACFKRGNELFLTVVNPSEEDKHVVVEIDQTLLPEGTITIKDLLSRKSIPQNQHLTFFVPGKNGTVISIKGD